MISLIGTALNQWDVGRSVTVTESEATHVHFANLGDTKAVIMELVDSKSKIPDYLLQTGKQLCVYAVANGVTIERRTFPVTKRERPEDYVYEEDQRNYIYEFLHSVAGKKTEEGGEIFNDYTTNKATAEFATAFGSESKAAGECSIAGGKRIFKSGAECVAEEWLHGEYGFTLKIYIADPDEEYAKNTIHCEEAKKEIYESGSTHECWRDVSEWLAEQEEYGFPVPDMLMTEDGRFCLLEDWRCNEAYGRGSVAIGKGAVAYSRASKSFGYRTQTGYPPSAEIAALRPEAFVKTDENGDPEYPADNVGQAAFAIGADTVAAANQSFAGGWKSKALAHAAFAFGTDNVVRGDSSASFGGSNKVEGSNSLSVGTRNVIELHNSIVAGADNTVGGNQSIVVGSNNVASGKTTQAIFGIGNEADRIGQTVVGLYNVKDTDSLFVVGNGTDKDHKSNAITVGFSSTNIHNNLKTKKNIIGGEAEVGSSTDHSLVIGGVNPATGENTKATSQYNFVFGRASQATKWGAIALGDSNISSGYNSLATGANTEALKDNSATFGKGTKTGRQSQAVVGQWNEVDTGALFIVGNGTSDTKRKNALVVTENGGVEVAGQLSFGSIDAASRRTVITHKTANREPYDTDFGDFVGQIWLMKEGSRIVGVYMYAGDEGSEVEPLAVWTSIGLG